MNDGFDINLKRKLESSVDRVSAVRRIELITGAARRRRWSSDEKARIVVESLRSGANVSEVARRNGLSPQQLFGWRREAHTLFRDDADTSSADRPASATARQPRRRQEQHAKSDETGADTAMFAPVVITAASPSAPTPSSRPSGGDAGRLEIAIGDAVVRVIGQVETATLVAVLRAVRRSS
jgi:transposase